MKRVGLKLDGYVFKQNGTVLNLYEFIEILEEAGLEFGGATNPVDENGEIVKSFS